MTSHRAAGRRTLSRGVLLGVIALALLAVAPVPAGANEDDGQAAYRTRTAGTVETEVPPACDDSAPPLLKCDFTTEAEVRGTHIGRGAASSAGVATLDLSGTCEDPDGNVGIPISTTADAVVVAADGSELHSVNDASGCFVSFELPLYQEGTQTITQGNGRFADASGVQDFFVTTFMGSLESLTIGRINLNVAHG